MPDPYIDPRTGTLKNLLGITDPDRLVEAEGWIALAREYQLNADRGLVPGHYDLAHLQALHRWLFGSVYSWAGDLRTVNITKGSTTFAMAAHLQIAATEVFARLARESFLRGRSASEFAVGAAWLLGDLNALHPFREGNGRTQRSFLQVLAFDAGWQLRWAAVTAEEMVAASERAMHDAGAFVPMLEAIVVRASAPLGPADRLLRRRGIEESSP